MDVPWSLLYRGKKRSYVRFSINPYRNRYTCTPDKNNTLTGTYTVVDSQWITYPPVSDVIYLIIYTITTQCNKLLLQSSRNNILLSTNVKKTIHIQVIIIFFIIIPLKKHRRWRINGSNLFEILKSLFLILLLYIFFYPKKKDYCCLLDCDNKHWSSGITFLYQKYTFLAALSEWNKLKLGN